MIRLLDPGAGAGALTAAFVEQVVGQPRLPREIEVDAWEIDDHLIPMLEQTLARSADLAKSRGVAFRARIHRSDFVEDMCRRVATDLFGHNADSWDCVITNPPYRKVPANSRVAQILRSVGADATNLYSAFLSLSQKALAPGGELVSITPRSFCNGRYFRDFRRAFLREMSIERIQLFEARDDAFGDDEVLQENIIIHARKGPQQAEVELRSSTGKALTDLATRMLAFDRIVHPHDAEAFVRIPTDRIGEELAEQMGLLKTSLGALGLSASTGRVVDFRVSSYLRQAVSNETAPLVYPTHLDHGSVRWPKAGKKPNAILRHDETESLLVPAGTYVLTKRFSSKEERRRVVAAVVDPDSLPGSKWGFENHLNFFHRDGRGLPARLAQGLSVFLNSTILDQFFRQLSGHTQVNVTDLRNLRYPTEDQLLKLGELTLREGVNQSTIDELVTKVLFAMPPTRKRRADPVKKLRRVDEAIAVLRAIGMPRQQTNERTALTLLGLLDLKPELPWSEAEAPLVGVTPLMDFFRTNFGKDYAPNTRETIRRQSIHQLLEAGHLLINPDQPERPTNSGNTVYQVTQRFLELVRSFESPSWTQALEQYLRELPPLKARYERERASRQIPVALPTGGVIQLSAGGQNKLIKPIIEEFGPRFTPGAKLLYIGDTTDKFVLFDESGFELLGLTLEEHGKMPDVVLHDRTRNWLVLVEAVTSHGPVDAKRRDELKRLFSGPRAGLVFVTAFLDRRSMTKYLDQISWETEVWVADAPSHLIHFDGERFLGPYDS